MNEKPVLLNVYYIKPKNLQFQLIHTNTTKNIKKINNKNKYRKAIFLVTLFYG